MPSYNVYSGDSSVLAAKINSTQTTGVTIAAMNINGTLTGWANTAGVIEVSEQSDSTLKREWIYYTGSSVDATTKIATLSGVVRGLTSTTSDVTSGGTGVAFSKGATVRFVTFHDLLNKKANLDRTGSFSANQTFTTNTKIIFGGSGAYIYSTDGGTNLVFKDGSTSEQTLSGLAAAAGTDHKLLNTASDTTASYLTTKLLAGDGITMTTGSPGGNETSTIAAVNTVPTGHTGLSSVTSGNLLLGAGTSNMTELAPSTSGKVPMSNGSTFTMKFLVAVGAMMLWTTDSAPTGWLLCYGQAVSRTTYADLFAVISTTFGVGDGSTTFNLPDMRGRFPLGQDDMGGSSANRITNSAADTIGSTGGTADGAHTHVMTKNASYNTSNSGALPFAIGDGTSGSTSVVPPYQTFNYIIFANA